MRECNACGYPIGTDQICPKCDMVTESSNKNKLLTVDVAHAGESWENAHAMIIEALNDAMRNDYKGLKIIHGYGSLTGKAIIGPRAISLMRHLADENGGRYAKDQNNPGSSLIWFNRINAHRVTKDPIYYSTGIKYEETENWFDQAKKNKYK